MVDAGRKLQRFVSIPTIIIGSSWICVANKEWLIFLVATTICYCIIEFVQLYIDTRINIGIKERIGSHSNVTYHPNSEKNQNITNAENIDSSGNINI